MNLEVHAAAENRRGILCMCGAMACFIVNDALVKLASQSLPMAQLIFMRSVMVALIVLAAARISGATARIGDVIERPVLLRALIDACATMLYLGSLKHLPLGNASAINLAAPLFMVVFVAFFMAERVALARWFGTVAGFLGVLMVIQPAGDGFNAWSLVCLLATVLHAARDLLTRRIRRDIPSILITLATALTATLLAGGLSLGEGWRAFGAREVLLLAGAAALVAGGFYLIIASMRHGEISLVAPFRYSGLLVALVVGYLLWGEAPNAAAWAGIALLIGSGLFVLQVERRRAAAMAGASR